MKLPTTATSSESKVDKARLGMTTCHCKFIQLMIFSHVFPQAFHKGEIIYQFIWLVFLWLLFRYTLANAVSLHFFYFLPSYLLKMPSATGNSLPFTLWGNRSYSWFSVALSFSVMLPTWIFYTLVIGHGPSVPLGQSCGQYYLIWRPGEKDLCLWSYILGLIVSLAHSWLHVFLGAFTTWNTHVT